MLDGVCGAPGTIRSCGDDVICCDTEDEGCGLRMWLRLVAERSPTDTILAATGEDLGGLDGGSSWRGSDLSAVACCIEEPGQLVGHIGLESKCRGLDWPVASVGGTFRKVMLSMPTSESPTRSGPVVLFFARFAGGFFLATGFLHFSALAVFGIVNAPSGVGKTAWRTG